MLALCSGSFMAELQRSLIPRIFSAAREGRLISGTNRRIGSAIHRLIYGVNSNFLKKCRDLIHVGANDIVPKNARPGLPTTPLQNLVLDGGFAVADRRHDGASGLKLRGVCTFGIKRNFLLMEVNQEACSPLSKIMFTATRQ
jgi:hypothetical protein